MRWREKQQTKVALTPEDWVKAGFRALSVGGPQAIKVEAIAKALKVSKGSFYWHFKDVSALKTDMLRHWLQVATHDIISDVAGDEPGPKEQLRRLVDIATGKKNEPYGGAQAEAAIRDWARYDENAAATLKTVDATRRQFLSALFEKSGVPPAQCTSYANILYAALIGLEQLSLTGVLERKNDLSALLALLLRNAERE
ncbi:MAG: TetR/AcrR family transcriptional regulator [Gammaproteobacteria bacterium]|nr:TetR/AcrR family transcriptional regulator [Gammaproteobacteria bacterium]